MRKLEKLLSVFIAITLIFGLITVPAFAAQSLKYEDKAWVLYQLDLFKGVSTTEYKPNLEAKLLREEAVALLLRMFNLEDEALKMSEKEAKQILSNKFKDADQIAAWAVKYVAYAADNGVIAGRPDGNFAPKDNLLGREYAKMILAMLGYVQDLDFQYQFATVEFCNVTGFSKSEAAKLDTSTILRDHVVGMSFYALKAEYVAGANKGTTVIEAIVVNDEDKREIAINAGLIEKPVIVSVEAIPDIEIKVGQLLRLPSTVKATYSDGRIAYVAVEWPNIDTSKAMPKTQIFGKIESSDIRAKVNITIKEDVLRVENVTADNLKEIVVVYNQDVSKNAAVAEKGNYTLNIGKKVTGINVDGNTAILTVEDGVRNQIKAKLTVSEKILGNKAEIEFTFFDATLPDVLDLIVTGPKKIELTFSEPIKTSPDAKVTVKSGYSTISMNKGAITGWGTNTITVPIYSSFIDGREYNVTIENFEDYAGYKNIIRTKTFVYEKDETAPVATIDEATQEYVKVSFNKPVSGLTPDHFSHTFTAWKAMKLTVKDTYGEDADAVKPTDSVKTVYVWFYKDGKSPSKERPIPEGETTFNILAKASGYEIKDDWGNKFIEEDYIITVAADRTAPEVKEIVVTGEDEFTVEFTKSVTFKYDDNLEILDDEGEEITGLNVTITPDAMDRKFTVKLSKNLKGKTIIVNIKDVKDATLNANKLYFYSTVLEIGDKSSPEVTKVTYEVQKDGSEEVAWYLYAFFNEDVDSDAALNPNNYYLKNGMNYTKLTEDAEFYAGEKIVKISLTSKQKDQIKIGTTELFVTNVKDIAGNEILPQLTKITDIKHSDNAPFMKKAVAVERDKIEVTFSEELATYDTDAFEIKLNGVSTPIEVIGLDPELDSEGQTKLTLLIDGALPFNTSLDKVKIVEPNAITNLFGVKPVILEKTIEDGIKPEVIAKNPVIVSSDGKIIIRFTEALNSNTSLYMPMDLVIEKRSDGEELEAGTEYTVTVDNTKETLWIEGEYIDVYGKLLVNIKSVSPSETYRVYSKGTITYIKDAKGNTAKPFTKIIEIKGSDLLESMADELIAAKAAINSKVQADYTQESWAVFVTARTAALALPESTGAEIVAKINAINTAIAGLVFAGQADLDAAKLAASAKVESDYTQESWAAFVAAWEEALELPETTNQEIVAKTTAINNAIACLVFTPEAALNKAIAEAKDDGTSTIILTGDVTADVNIEKLVSLNLAGYTITGDVTIESNATGEIYIYGGTIDGDLTVNTPNATVNNSANVTGTTTIVDVSTGTWNENANGNTIVIQDNTGITFNVAPGNTVGSLTLNTAAAVTLMLGEGAGITNPVIINEPVTLISPHPVQAIIANGVKVKVKASVDGEAREITGTGGSKVVTVTADPSIVVITGEELLAALGNNNIATITLAGDITLTAPLALNRKVAIDGGGKTLTINSGEGNTGDNTAAGLGIFADGVEIKNITVKGNHGDNLIEIYNNATLENVTATGGKKAGIYVNNDREDATITVDFKNITTSGNGWNAGIGLAAQKEGGKVTANFSGTHNFGEPVALYHEGINYPGTYEVKDPAKSLAGYAEVTVGTQQKWVKVTLTDTEEGIKLESSCDIEGLKTYVSLTKIGADNKDEPVAFKTIFTTFVLKTDNDVNSYDMMQYISEEDTSFAYGPSGGYKLEAGKPQTTKVESYSLAVGAPEGSYKLTIQVKQGDKLVAQTIKTFEIPVSTP